MQPHNSRRPLAAGILLALAVYLPRLGSPLAWDDLEVIEFNGRLGGPAPPSAWLGRDYFAFSREATWRPLATLSYHAPVALAGKRPWLLRLPNLALHLLNALLLAALLAGLGWPAAAASWAAALWLVHPAHVETLMCVSFNEDVLCACGLLVLLLAHSRKRTWLAVSGLAVAVLSKETGVLGLPLVFLLDRADGRTAWRKRARAYAAYAAVLALYALTAFVLLKPPGTADGVLGRLPLTERVYYALAGLATAARVFLAPVQLSIDYFAVPPERAAEGIALAGLGLGVLALALRGLLRTWRGEPRLAALFAWPLLFLGLTSGLVPAAVLGLRLFAERWLYLPGLGLCALAGRLLGPRPVLAAALLAFWGGAGLWRAADWSDETRLWEGLARAYPWSGKARQGLGEAFFRAGRHPEALDAFEHALWLRTSGRDRVLARYAPLSAGALPIEPASLHRWLGLSHLKVGPDLTRAEEHFRRAAALEPGHPLTYRVLAYLAARGGRFPEARAWLEKGLAADPRDPFLARIAPDLAAGRVPRLSLE